MRDYIRPSRAAGTAARRAHTDLPEGTDEREMSKEGLFGRDDIERGMITFHPCGFTHGPHPKALGGMFTPRKAATDEYAVMLDTRDALEVGPLPEGVENHAYMNSWMPR